MNAISPGMHALRVDMGIPISGLDQSPVPTRLDATLLGLRDEFRAAVARMAEINRNDGVSDEELESVVEHFNASCWAIADAPPALTQAGRALKAAAAKQQLRGEFNLEVVGDWPDRSHELVWHILGEIAGDEYVSSTAPEFEPPDRASAIGGASS